MQLSVVVWALHRASPEHCFAAAPPNEVTTRVEASDDEAERCWRSLPRANLVEGLDHARRCSDYPGNSLVARCHGDLLQGGATTFSTADCCSSKRQ